MSKGDTLIIRLGDQEVDVAKGGKLKWGDVKKIRSLGIEDDGLQKGDPEQIEKFVRFLIGRAIEREPSQEEIDDLDLEDLMAVAQFFSTAVEGAVNRPT